MYGRQRPGFDGSPYPLTPAVKWLLISNVAVFFVQLMFGLRSEFTWAFSVSVEGMLRGMLWQPFTYMWLHAGPMHLLFNMFMLWMFGGTLEGVWGSRRFVRFYLTCGVGAGFVILFWNAIAVDPFVPTLGASGAIYGLLAAFALTWPDRTLFLIFPPIPIKAIWMIPLLFLLQVVFAGGNISHAGHLGGVLVAAVLMRKQLGGVIGFKGLRYRWHRYRMRNRLRAVQRDDWERRRKSRDEDEPPKFH